MNEINIRDIIDYVANNISVFHNKRLESLSTLELSRILKRKNPYLFKAKHLLTAEAIIGKIVEAYISYRAMRIYIST